MPLMRSLMFVPGHRPRMIERALGVGEFAPSQLDAAILDLEDGVPPDQKQIARAAIAAALVRSAAGPARFVRINASDPERSADLGAVVREGLDGIVAPKVDDRATVEALARTLDERERAAGLARGSIQIVASIESARGLIAAPDIAGSERVSALLFGAEDFARDLGLPPDREDEAAELLYARSAIVVAAVAARRSALDGIWPAIADIDGLRRDALTARRLGFTGKSVVHPGHIETVNEVFSPSTAEVDHAGRVLRAFSEAARRGDGAVALDGKLLDAPIVDRARRTLALHEAISSKRETPPVERPAALEGKLLK